MSSSSPSRSRARAAFSASVAVACSDRTARSVATIQLPRGRGNTRRHRWSVRCGVDRVHSRLIHVRIQWARRAPQPDRCSGPGSPEDASPKAVSSHSAISPWLSTKPAGSNRVTTSAQNARQTRSVGSALRRVGEHRERELERAVRQAAPIERRVAAVAEVRQRRQLGPVHDVHLGLRWTPPHVVRAQAPASRCGAPVPTSDEPGPGASSRPPRMATRIQAGTTGRSAMSGRCLGACFPRVESSGTSYLDGTRTGRGKDEDETDAERYGLPRPVYSLAATGRRHPSRPQRAGRCASTISAPHRARGRALGRSRRPGRKNPHRGERWRGTESVRRERPQRPDWKGTGGQMRDLEFDLHHFSSAQVIDNGRARRAG